MRWRAPPAACPSARGRAGARGTGASGRRPPRGRGPPRAVTAGHRGDNTPQAAPGPPQNRANRRQERACSVTEGQNWRYPPPMTRNHPTSPPAAPANRDITGEPAASRGPGTRMTRDHRRQRHARTRVPVTRSLRPAGRKWPVRDEAGDAQREVRVLVCHLLGGAGAVVLEPVGDAEAHLEDRERGERRDGISGPPRRGRSSRPRGSGRCAGGPLPRCPRPPSPWRCRGGARRRAHGRSWSCPPRSGRQLRPGAAQCPALPASRPRSRPAPSAPPAPAAAAAAAKWTPTQMLARSEPTSLPQPPT